MDKSRSVPSRFGTSLVVLLAGLVSIGCAAAQTDPVIAVAQVETNRETAAHAMSSPGVHTPELEMPAPFALNPDKGSEIGVVYEAYLSPEQEGDDEEDTPAMAPAVFKSTAPSVPRHLRSSRGHGTLSFTNDLSKAFVHVAVEDVNPDDIVMFHIHCGRPGQLGPILVDFGLKGDLTDYFEDGYFAMEVVNEDIDAAVESGEGIVGAFAAGCPIVPTSPMDKVKTVGGMQFIAEQGELYFNLHTKGQTFFGDIRGQLRRVETEVGN